jgi:hypothetical protein
MNARDQHRRIVTTERHFRTDALADARTFHRDAQYDRKHHNYVLAAWHEREAGWDMFWANRRQGIVKKNQRLAGKRG